MFIDLKQLTTKAWNKILSEETYNQIVNENPNKDTNKTAYSYIYKRQNEALQEAWNNFKANPVKKLEKNLNNSRVKTASGWIKTACTKLYPLNMAMITGLYGIQKQIKICLTLNP